MAIRESIEGIAAGWAAYRQRVRVTGTDPVYSMVTKEFPKQLRSHLATFDSLRVEGSTGRGQITAAPWIAVFDSRLTVSATSEYYVVYLFSTDMSTVTLSLAFGTTQFEEQFGGPAKSFPRMRLAATRLQETFSHLVPARMKTGPINLSANPGQALHYAYEQSAIFSFDPYSITALPAENQLVSDLQLMVELYVNIVSDPLEASVDRLVEAVVEPASRISSIDVRTFEPRTPKTTGASKEVGKGSHHRRYSPESRKVGDAGERVVIQYEKERLVKIGRSDLAGRIIWHSQDLQFPGWDITSFDDQGEPFFIEVKSSIGRVVSSVNLTLNEWIVAMQASRRDRYWIYIVTEALSAAPRIERLRNPAAYVDAKTLLCQPIVYELRLSA